MMRQWNSFNQVVQDMEKMFEDAFSLKHPIKIQTPPFYQRTILEYRNPQELSDGSELVYHMTKGDDKVDVQVFGIKIQSREGIGVTTTDDEVINHMALWYQNKSGVLGLNVNEHKDVVYQAALYVAKAIKGDKDRDIIFVDGTVCMQSLRAYKDPIVVVNGKANFHLAPWRVELGTAYYQMFSTITVLVLHREFDSDFDANIHSLSLWTPQVDYNIPYNPVDDGLTYDQAQNGVIDKDDAAREDLPEDFIPMNPYENGRGPRYL